MAKRSNTFQELDDAIEAAMAHPDQPPPAVSPRLAALLRIAGDLRDLPSREFRERLKAELLSGARGAPTTAVARHYGKPLMTVADYLARIEELKSQPQFLTFDLATALSGLPERGTRFLTSLNECTLGVSYFAGHPHWECHPAADELLHILDGEAEVETMTDDGPVRSQLRAGSLFICPQGLWHRVRPRSASVSMFFATPGEGTIGSDAKVPPPNPAAAKRGKVELVAHDLHRALSGLPELAISAQTTEEEADAATRSLTTLGPCTLGLMRYSGLTPWERHPDGDELLHVLEGAVDVTVLADDGPRQVSLHAGSVFVCPKGLWHRQLPRPSVTMLYGTPTKHGEASCADDPRVGEA